MGGWITLTLASPLPMALVMQVSVLSRAAPLLALAICGLMMLGTPALAAAAPGDAAVSTDARLSARAARLEGRSMELGASLLRTDERRIQVAAERELAQALLTEWVVGRYQIEGSGGGAFADLMSFRSLEELSQRVQLAAVITDHLDQLQETLEQANAQLDAGRLQHARDVARLTALQGQIAGIHAEQERRAVAAQARRDEQDARAARAQATVADGPGVLVASGGASSPFAAGSVSSQPGAATIDAYLATKSSPMFGSGAAFVASGTRYGIDPRLLVAIAGAESNFGAITCGPHNAWGWACPNDPADFETWAAGIETVTRGLRRGYLDEGRTTVNLIHQKYAPNGAANDPTGLNSHWTINVTRFLIEQGGNPSMVGVGPTARPELPDLGGLGLG